MDNRIIDAAPSGSEAGTIASGCSSVMVLSPDDVKDKTAKDTLFALVAAHGAGNPINAKFELVLPPEKEPQRLGLAARAYNALMLKVLPKRKASALEERLEREAEFRKIEAEYAWLVEAGKVYSAAVGQIRKSHEGIASYVENLTQSCTRLEAILKEREVALPRMKNLLKELEKDIADGSRAREIAQNLYGDSSQQYIEKAKAPMESMKADVEGCLARMPEENEYMHGFLERAQNDVEAGMQSLVALKGTGKTIARQEMELKRTIQTYEGLTQHQMQATRALDFFRDAERLTEALKEGITSVNNAFHEQAVDYASREPSLQPAPDTGYVRRLQAAYGSMDSIPQELMPAEPAGKPAGKAHRLTE